MSFAVFVQVRHPESWAFLEKGTQHGSGTVPTSGWIVHSGRIAFVSSKIILREVWRFQIKNISLPFLGSTVIRLFIFKEIFVVRISFQSPLTLQHPKTKFLAAFVELINRHSCVARIISISPAFGVVINDFVCSFVNANYHASMTVGLIRLFTPFVPVKHNGARAVKQKF